MERRRGSGGPSEGHREEPEEVMSGNVRDAKGKNDAEGAEPLHKQ